MVGRNLAQRSLRLVHGIQVDERDAARVEALARFRRHRAAMGIRSRLAGVDPAGRVRGRLAHEANEMFDALTYGKGSSLLRMIEQFIGEEEFRKESATTSQALLRQHRDRRSVGGSRTTPPVSPSERSWTPGFTSGVSPARGVPTGSGIKISQRRYLTIPDESDQTLWQIPVQTRQLGNSDATRSSSSRELRQPALRIGQWSGSQRRWSRVLPSQVRGRLVLGSRGEAGDLDDLKRYIVIDDTWAFVESGQQSAADYLRLASAYRQRDRASHMGSGPRRGGHDRPPSGRRRPSPALRYLGERAGRAGVLSTRMGAS